MVFQCASCPSIFTTKRSLNRHSKEHGEKLSLQCPLCDNKFGRKDNLTVHFVKQHNVERKLSKDLAEKALITFNDAKRRNDGDLLIVPKKKSRRSATPETRTVTIDEPTPPPPNSSPHYGTQSSFHSPSAGPSTLPDNSTPSPAPNTTPEDSIPTDAYGRAAWYMEKYGNGAGVLEMMDSRVSPDPDDIPDHRTPSPGPTTNDTSAPPSPQAESNSWSPEDHYEMKLEKKIYSRKLQTEQSDYRIKVKPFETDNFADIRDRLRAILQSVLDACREKAPPDAHGLFSLTMQGIDDYIHTRVDNIHQLNVDDILASIERLLNSNEEASASNFKVRIIFTEHSNGGRGNGAIEDRGGPNHDPGACRARKNSLMDVAKNSNDNMCLARCLVVGKHVADHPDNFRTTQDPKFKTLVDGRHASQRHKAMSLCERAGVDHNLPCGHLELAKFQEHLKRYQIMLYESYAGDTVLTFPTEYSNQPPNNRIYIWLFKGHYTLINPNMVAGFLGARKFCHHCLKTWSDGGGGNGGGIHKCENAICRLCKNLVCKNAASHPSEVPVECDDCNRTFESVHCKTAHKESKICDKKFFCKRCRSVVPRKKRMPTDHNCLLNRCQHCQGYFEVGEHKCYMKQPKKGKKRLAADDLEVAPDDEDIHFLLGEYNEEHGYEDDHLDAQGNARAQPKKRKSFFCDIEAEINNESHDPILLCMVNEDGSKEYIYYGEDCLTKFINDLNQKDEFKDSTYIFHNLAGYDGIHLLRVCYDLVLDPKPLFRGGKVLTMGLAKSGVKFIDSYLHLAIPLSKIPSCYGILETVKGFFPYLLATKECRDYKGPFPALEFFDPFNMLPDRYALFIQWYAEEKALYDADPNKVYDMKAEMIKYCLTDCHLERKGFTKYTETMKERNGGIDPKEMITLPSYVNHVYRSLHMPIDTIPVLPPMGYDQRGMQSIEALTWLLWQSRQLGLPISHGRNGGEIKFGPFYLDGFTKSMSGMKVALEYNGCPWHGCPVCYKDRMDEVFTSNGKSVSYGDRQKETKDKKEFLEANGFHVISTYSCKFRKEQEDDMELAAFVVKMKERLRNQTPLAPRDTMRGGRTNAVVKFYVPKDGEAIFYMDFTSLYPSVNCCLDDDQSYPIGHPQILLDPDTFPPMEEIFGLIKCRILPPKQLFMPVLPVFEHGKVLFGLCGTCIKEGNSTTKCTHNDAERCLENTFVSLEVQKAIEHGYEVKEIHEIWNWPPNQRSKTLFRDFLLPTYTKKFQASGWPKGFKTREERENLLDMYSEQQDIHMTYDSVYEIKNAAETSSDKLHLNNFWGYLAKNSSGEVKRCTSYKEYMKYVLDKEKDITCMWLVDENVMFLELTHKPEFERVDPKTSVVSAAFTTAMARIKLHKELEKTGRRTLYFDTDSIIWVQRAGEEDLVPGPLLGQLTDEIFEKYGEHAMISTFAAAGPKTYALLIDDKRTGERIDTILKCKGVRLTVKASEKVTAESLIELIKENDQVMVPQRIMRRDKKTGTITSKSTNKRLRVTFSKRLWPDAVDEPSLPIGWQETN